MRDVTGRDVFECCIVDRSNGIIECIVVVLVVIVRVHQTEVLKRQRDVLTSLVVVVDADVDVDADVGSIAVVLYSRCCCMFLHLLCRLDACCCCCCRLIRYGPSLMS